jgi:hypothetical protein
MLQFQFKKPLHQVLSRMLLRTFPGIDKVWLIAEDTDKENFALYETNQNAEKSQLVEEVEIKKNNYLNSKYFYRWISLNETPLSADKEVRMQYNIFDEYKNRILHLYLPPDKGEFMVFYIFFNEKQAVSGPNTDSRLTTENKQFIAHTIYNLLIEYRMGLLDDQKVARNLQKIQHRMAHNNNAGHLEAFVKSYIDDYLQKASEANGVRIDIATNAVERLCRQQLTPQKLTELLDEAIAWLLNFNRTGQSHFTIESIHIAEEPISNENEELRADHLHEEKYNRTYELLDKIEKAALRVINTGQKLTGVNVGQAFETPISAPAITDALRKHAGKIRTLARIYPDRWPIIRHQFKSLQNILENDDTIAVQSA